jgi:hypothetical protein
LVNPYANNKVDRHCEIKNVTILNGGEYHCHLQLDDISYNEDQQTKYIVMQLLERGDGKKWYVWFKQGKVARENFSTSVKEFFNKYDA